jgi:ABC-type transporter Mla subunit MlaD
MRRFIAFAAIFGAGLAAAFLGGAGGETSKNPKYTIQFDNAFGLVEGGDLKIGGVRAGKTTGFGIQETQPGSGRFVAEVEAEVTQPGYANLHKDASCTVRPQSLIGEYFVDCQPGKAKEALPDNTVPVAQTSSVVNQDLINNVLRRPYRERFRLILSELGTGLAGRPSDIQEVIKRAHPGLRETSQVLEILGRQNKIIQDFITNSDTVVAQLEKKKRDVARWVDEAGTTAEISASRRDALEQQFQKFPTFLDELKPTMVQLGRLTDEQTPLMRDLQKLSPDLREFFDRLGPFSEASRPAFRSLGKLGKTGKAALRESSQEIDQLRKLAADAPELARPLRQFFESLDDRNRSVYVDPRAAESAPPAPDKTADAKGKGFTGFEALWNYLFWQTQSISAFDEVSHILRVAVFASECENYSADPSPDLQKHCGAYLGPYQPGLQGNAPDPTEGNLAAAKAEGRDKVQAKGNRRRGAGQPEVPVRPGEKDLSKPGFALPPAIKKLLDELPKLPTTTTELKAALPPGTTLDESTSATLLDYLLSP